MLFSVIIIFLSCVVCSAISPQSGILDTNISPSSSMPPPIASSVLLCGKGGYYCENFKSCIIHDHEGNQLKYCVAGSCAKQALVYCDTPKTHLLPCGMGGSFCALEGLSCITNDQTRLCQEGSCLFNEQSSCKPLTSLPCGRGGKSCSDSSMVCADAKGIPCDIEGRACIDNPKNNLLFQCKPKKEVLCGFGGSKCTKESGVICARADKTSVCAEEDQDCLNDSSCIAFSRIPCGKGGSLCPVHPDAALENICTSQAGSICQDISCFSNSSSGCKEYPNLKKLLGKRCGYGGEQCDVPGHICFVKDSSKLCKEGQHCALSAQTSVCQSIEYLPCDKGGINCDFRIPLPYVGKGLLNISSASALFFEGELMYVADNQAHTLSIINQKTKERVETIALTSVLEADGTPLIIQASHFVVSAKTKTIYIVDNMNFKIWSYNIMTKAWVDLTLKGIRSFPGMQVQGIVLNPKDDSLYIAPMTFSSALTSADKKSQDTEGTTDASRSAAFALLPKAQAMIGHLYEYKPLSQGIYVERIIAPNISIAFLFGDRKGNLYALQSNKILKFEELNKKNKKNKQNPGSSSIENAPESVTHIGYIAKEIFTKESSREVSVKDCVDVMESGFKEISFAVTDQDDNIFIADKKARLIRMISQNSLKVITVAGSTPVQTQACPFSSAVQARTIGLREESLDKPLYVDKNGNIYYNDGDVYYKIQKTK